MTKQQGKSEIYFRFGKEGMSYVFVFGAEDERRTTMAARSQRRRRRVDFGANR